jgi:hypothetical protein
MLSREQIEAERVKFEAWWTERCKINQEKGDFSRIGIASVGTRYRDPEIQKRFGAWIGAIESRAESDRLKDAVVMPKSPAEIAKMLDELAGDLKREMTPASMLPVKADRAYHEALCKVARDIESLAAKIRKP